MDPKVLFSTFGLIFLAELGDKTQLTTMMLAAQSRAPIAVFLGAGLALGLSALLGVLLGETVTRLIPPHIIQRGAGVAFVLLGLFLLVGRK